MTTASQPTDLQRPASGNAVPRHRVWLRLRHILEMIRFSHTLFALPFALLAGVMAWTANARGEPPVTWRWQELMGILLCMVTARSAAMAFNRIADWKHDAANPRTSQRHIPAGILSVGSVSLFAAANALGFIAATLLFWPNWLPLALSVPVLTFLLGYSLTKRFTSLAHFWLGAALMLAPVAAWIAIRGGQLLRNPADLLPAAVLGGAVLLWTAGFDMIYACQDFDFDVAAGLHSMPARLGIQGALRLAAICHAGMLLLLAALPWFYPAFGWIYGTGVAAAALLLAYEHYLVRPDDLSRVNRAFFQVNAVVSIGLFCVACLDIFLG
jgi:4-hydroxybenzoate polyprenyltransferase